MNLPHITHLSLSGGGLSGLSYIGVIRYLQTENMTNRIRHVSGTSIGSFFATVVALDIPYIKVEALVKEYLVKGISFDKKNIINIIHSLGIANADFMIEPLRKYIRETYGTDDMTFLELSKRTGKHLVICSTCIELGQPTYFSIDSTPDVGILQAVMASMALPLLVKPVKIGEFHYSDGGTTDNHPVTCFGEDTKTMIAIKLQSKFTIPSNVMSSLPTYILSLFYVFLNNADKQYTNIKWHIVLDECPLSFLPLSFEDDKLVICITEKAIDESILYGYKAMYEWVKCTYLDCSSSR
jgi:predicted acylesterase/phospholipase RssA